MDNLNQPPQNSGELLEVLAVEKIINKFTQQGKVVMRKLEGLLEKLKNNEDGNKYKEEVDSISRMLGENRTLKAMVLFVALISPAKALGGDTLNAIIKAVENQPTVEQSINGGNQPTMGSNETHLTAENIIFPEGKPQTSAKKMPGVSVNGHSVKSTSPGVYNKDGIKIIKTQIK